MPHAARIQRLASDLERPLLVSSLVNIRYLTGFTGTAATLVVLPGRSVFVTDGRYAEAAGELVVHLPETEVVVRGPDLVAAIGDVLGDVPEVDVEANHVSWAFVRELADALTARIRPTTGVVEELRRGKDQREIAALRRAAAAGDSAFRQVPRLATLATTEDQLGELLVAAMRAAGGSAAAWPPIVAMGPNAARPHHRAGTAALRDGPLLMDYGCVVDGYHSDMTRTVWLGLGDDPELAAIHEAVRAANEAGIGVLRPGVAARDVDEACRAELRDRGYEEHLLHSTGHGVGLEIHEAPWLRRTSEDVLRPGDVVTVEPGVYLPGRGGVRIEDMVLVTDDGHDVLTHSDKALRLGAET